MLKQQTATGKTDMSDTSGGHISTCMSSGLRKKKSKDPACSFPQATHPYPLYRGLMALSQDQCSPSASILQLPIDRCPSRASVCVHSGSVPACARKSQHTREHQVTEVLKALFGFGWVSLCTSSGKLSWCFGAQVLG